MRVTGKGMQGYGCGLGFSTLAEPVPWARVHGLPTGLPMGFPFGKHGATLVLTPAFCTLLIPTVQYQIHE